MLIIENKIIDILFILVVVDFSSNFNDSGFLSDQYSQE